MNSKKCLKLNTNDWKSLNKSIASKLRLRQSITLLLLLLETVITVAIAFLIQELINNIGTGIDITLITITSILIIIHSLFVFAANKNFNCLGRLSRQLMRSCIYNNVLHNFNLLMNSKTGELTSITFNDAGDLGERLGQRIVLLLAGSLQTIIVMGIIYYFSWIVGLVVTVIYPIYFGVCSFVDKRIQKYTLEVRRGQASSEHIMLKGLQGWLELAILNKQKYYSNKYDKSLDNLNKQYKGYDKYNSLNIMLQDFVCSSLPIIAAIICTLPILIRNQSQPILLIYVLAGYLLQPLNSLTNIFQMWHEDKALKERLQEAICLEQDGNEGQYIDFIKNITVNINSYAYNDGEKILQNCRFDIYSGCVFAIRGASGVGKTTLLKIMTNLLPTHNLDGDVKYNGLTVKLINRKSLFNRLQLVSQSYFIFEDSLLNNLCMGNEYPKETINRIIDVCCLREFVNEYGLDLYIKENGKNVSQGQLQRICIARALLKTPDCLILDEPTSALDETVAQRLMLNLRDYTKENNLILIFISHKNELSECLDGFVDLI